MKWCDDVPIAETIDDVIEIGLQAPANQIKHKLKREFKNFLANKFAVTTPETDRIFRELFPSLPPSSTELLKKVSTSILEDQGD